MKKKTQPSWMAIPSVIPQGTDPGCPGGTGTTSTGTPGPKGDKGDPGPPGPEGAHLVILQYNGIDPTTGNADYTFVDSDSREFDFSVPSGPQGPRGLQGLQGDVGATGPEGKQGIQGLQGEVGPKGDIGPQGPKGDIGMVGATGARGPAGEKGSQGIPGAKGDTGKSGPPGTAATITIGTVTALSPTAKPTVANVGTENAAIFNFGLPAYKKQAINQIEITKGSCAQNSLLLYKSVKSLNPTDLFVTLSTTPGYFTLPKGEYKIEFTVTSQGSPINFDFYQHSVKTDSFKTSTNHLTFVHLVKVTDVSNDFSLVNARGKCMNIPELDNNKFNITITQISDQ